MDEKKKTIFPPQEMVEELDDAELSQVSGGVSGLAGGIAQRNLQRNSTDCASNMINIANSTNITGQKKYTIDRLAGSIYAPSPTRTDET